MSERVVKSKRPSKTEQRLRLVATIEELGFDVIPCSFCDSHHLHCQMMDGVSRCNGCVRRGRSCDGCGVPTLSLSKVVDESRRLREEEIAASAKLVRAHKDALEALAKLERLRKQRGSLASRGALMVNRGLQSLDELEASEKSETAVGTQLSGEVDLLDWNAIFSDGFPGAGGTVSAALGS